ncbi:L-fuculose-phosphate aldolase [Methanococcus voltae]|nr:L-fuculose-phosphate aldolase [Methanococcus voltae]
MEKIDNIELDELDNKMDYILAEFVDICRKLYERKYVVGSGGNVSIKVGNLVFITPTGHILGLMEKEKICIVDMDGDILKGKPTSELNMHLGIYKNRKDVNAIVHTHCMYCTAFSNMDKKIDLITPEGQLFIRKIDYVDYYPCGSMELANTVSKCGESAIVLKNHGLVTLGENILEAYLKTEVVEELAQMNYIIHNMKK